MIDNILAANSDNSEEIATPMKINLQLFAEGDPTPSADPIEGDPLPNVDPAPSSDPIPNTDPVPDVSTTKAFSDRLKESTTKAEDAVYSKLFGTEHGIHTKAAYDAAIAKQQEEADNAKFQETNGFDPNSVKPLFEEWKKSDPDFQELSTIRQEKNIATALSELNNELKDCGIDLNIKDFSDTEVAKLPNVDKVVKYVQSGKTFAEAVFLANKKEFIAKQAEMAQQDTIKKIAANGLSSPGSLSGGGDSDSKTIYSMSKADFAEMQTQVLRGERKKL
ncbi:MAG TPA: hypothetical protein VIK78_19775 [Ruminiclostridium sp.]